jgi:general secretion pathway protein B
MSILLDALKKSEEQRQLGRASGIHSPAGAHSTANEAVRQWVPLTLMAFSAIVMAWIGWQQYRQPEFLAKSATAPVLASPAVPSPAEPPDAATAEPVTATPGQAGLSDGEAPANQSQAALRSPVESFKVNSKSLQGATVMPPQDLLSAEPPKSRVGQAFADFEDAPQTAVAQQPAPAAANTPRATSKPPQGEAGRPKAAGIAPHVTEPISFWELPQGVRDSLPEMRITVLVYAESPRDRFLLIGGQRMVEKDEYQEGVVLDEIRRDGAVFLYRKYRFLIKG